MTRIFFTLSFLSVVLMIATLTVGLFIGDLRHDPTREAVVYADVHRIMGLATALAVVLVNSIVVTYFIGTSRWCKEVAETYALDRKFVQQSTQTKRRAFPWALGAMLTIVAVIALGAAADPMSGRKNLDGWDTIHMIAALAGMAVIIFAYFMQWNFIAANHRLIHNIMSEVRRIRQERGLDVEAAS